VVRTFRLGPRREVVALPHSPAKVDTANELRGPLLLMTGGKDHTVPEAVTRATLKQYRHSDAVTDLMEFPTAGTR